MVERKSGNIKKIFFNILWMLFDKVFILALNLLVTVKIANYYGTFEYGSYQYAVSVVALFEVLVTFVDARVVKKRYYSENAGELVWNATISRLFFSALASIGGTIYIIVSGESKDYNVIFLILLINAIVLNLRFGMQNRYEYLLKSRKVIIASNIALTIGGVLQLAAVHFHWSIVAISVITALSSLIALVIVYVQYRIDYGRLAQGKIKVEIIKGLLIESLPLAIAASCAIVYSRCDTIMVGNLLSKADVGVYSIAAKLISIVQIGIAPIRESVYPKMIQLYITNKKQYAKRYIQITSLFTWIYIVVVLLSFVILPYAFRVLNQEYAEAYPVYQVYVIGSFFMYNAGLRAGHYTLINRGNILMITQIISLGINLVLNYILIRFIGIYGAAIATGITQCISLFLSNLFFGKEGREVFFWQLKALNPFCMISLDMNKIK